MTGFLTAGIIRTALEVGLVYSLVALSLFISYSILNICDLSTDGCYTLGCAVGAVVTIAGHPFLAIFAAMAAGVCSGFVTAFLQTKLGVESILAGIIVVCLLIRWFLSTTLGLSIRATGDSPAMVRASSINPAFTITVGLCVANAITGLSGCLIAQYNKTCDINLGTGMVTIALASLVIGETLFGKHKMMARIFGMVVGSCLYRFIISVALRLNVPTEAFKLVSAVIVAVAIAAPRAKELVAFKHKQLNAIRERKSMQGGR